MDTNAAAGAEDRNCFATPDLRTTQNLVRGRQRVGNDADLGGIGFVVERFRQLDEDVRGQLYVFGIAAVAFKADIAAGVDAERLQVAEAKAAMAAVEVIIGGDGVAAFQARDASANGDDLGRYLVANDAREIDFAAAGLSVLDGEPGAAGDDARDRFARTGDGIGHLNQLEGRVRPP